MAKKSDNSVQPEKIEELRRDIQRIYDILNKLAPDVAQIQSLTKATNQQLKEVAKAVEDLEDQLPGAPPKRK